MSTRLPGLLLAATAAVGSYVVLIVGNLVPRFFEVAWNLRPGEVAGVVSPLTRFATTTSWVFVLAELLAVAVALLFFRLRPEQLIRVTVAALCVQGIVVWSALFCYCYDGFCGPMNLHHGPEFDLVRFCRFEAGVFPVTFLLMLLPLFACFVRRAPRSEALDTQAEPTGGPTVRSGDSGISERPPSLV